MYPDSLPTMHDVAAAAGVSATTVSNCVNRPAIVAPETRQRVRAAIDSLGYIPNAAARDLKRRRSDSIGLIVPDIVNSLFVDIARGAQAAAGREGLRLLMANAAYTFDSFAPPAASDLHDQYLDYFAEVRSRGILYAAMTDPTDGIRRIRSHVQPIVVVNYDQPGGWCSVLMDNEQAGRLAVEHLAGNGIRQLYFLSPPDVAQPIGARRRGVREASARRGVALTEIRTDGLWFEDGLRAARWILDQPGTAEPFAILAVTDELALGALRTLRGEQRYRVPEDVAVMGLDGTHRGEASDWLTLTSVTLPGSRMGEEALRLVIEETRPNHRHQRVVLPVEIRKGASTDRSQELRAKPSTIANGQLPVQRPDRYCATSGLGHPERLPVSRTAHTVPAENVIHSDTSTTKLEVS